MTDTNDQPTEIMEFNKIVRTVIQEHRRAADGSVEYRCSDQPDKIFTSVEEMRQFRGWSDAVESFTINENGNVEYAPCQNQ